MSTISPAAARTWWWRNPDVERRLRWVRRLTLLPTALLLLVAANQLRLAHTADLSAWKGGGFGMFSTTDGGPNRNLRIVGTIEGRDVEMRLPRHLGDLADRVEELPTRTWLERLACAVERDALDSGRPLDGIRLEVWRTRYAASDLRPSRERLTLHRQRAGTCRR